MTTRKVLYSPGFGAGWFSWHWHRVLLFDPILIQLVEENKHITAKDGHKKNNQDVSDEFKARCEELVGKEHVYYGGVYQLKVASVDGPFRIEEYDGSETIIQGYDLL